MHRQKSVAVAGFFAMAALGAFFASANLDTGEDRVMAYQGVLEHNGALVETPRNLRFALSTSDAAAMDCLISEPPGACGLWWEEHADVQVASGRFSVNLGEVSPLGDAVFNQPALHLAVAVEIPSAPGFVLLAGRQKIMPVAFANRAVQANNYEVKGDLFVEGEGQVANNLFVGGQAQVENELFVGGDAVLLSDQANKIRFRTQYDSSDLSTIPPDEALIGYDPSGAWPYALHIVGLDWPYVGKVVLLRETAFVEKNLYVAGPSQFNGNINASGGMSIQGDVNANVASNIYIQSTDWCDCDVDVNINSNGTYDCAAGKFIRGITQEKNCGNNDACLQKMTCCRPCHFAGYLP
jgi:cytoskeletal protein CcmA (bactofilin family)